MTEGFMTLENCHEHVGEEFVSSWIKVEQDRITAFGEAIDDPDPHHMDPECRHRVNVGLPAHDSLALPRQKPVRHWEWGSPSNQGFL